MNKRGKQDGKSGHSKLEIYCMRRTASWELVAEGGIQHQAANGEAFEANNRTIIDVCISAMSKNVTKNV